MYQDYRPFSFCLDREEGGSNVKLINVKLRERASIQDSYALYHIDIQLTMLYISLLIFQHSPYSVTQDCNKLMQGLFSQTLSVGNPLIEQTTASSSSTHQQSSEAVDYREMTGCEEQLSAQGAPHKPAAPSG